MSFLLGIMETGSPARGESLVRQVLDLLWLFMEVRCALPLPGASR